MALEHKSFKIPVSFLRRIVRSIPKNQQEYEQKKVPLFFLVATVLLAGLIIFKITITTYQYLSNFGLRELIGIFSAELRTDEKKRTNLLLLGAGGGEHDGANLTDSIMIASLNHEKHTTSLLSIPRDLWLDLPGYGSSRINKIYENLKGEYGSRQALDILRKGLENVTNLSIPYYVKVDFDAFKQVIDAVGGIEVVVEKSIFDEAYPNEEESGYEVFSLEAGSHLMDGETALKYARSRHSTSDFDRSSRQHKILAAIKKKAEEMNMLSSPLLLKELYEEFAEHLETNLNIRELISLAGFAEGLEEDRITSAVLRDIDIIDTGSFLYTPERELYGGAFVLVPFGDSYERIQRYIELAFDFPEFFQENATIQLLNGSTRYGLANQVGLRLFPYGYNIQKFGNADRKDYTITHYYIHRPEKTMVTEAVIQQFFPKALKMKNTPPEGIDTGYDITLVLAKDMELKNL